MPSPSTNRLVPPGTTVAAASFDAGRHLPSGRVACSSDLGWTSVLARRYHDPEETEGFTTASSPDLLVVINLRGSFTIESRHRGRWARAAYHPGAIGVTAPGVSSTLRWQREPSVRRESLHLFLSQRLLQDTAASLDRADPMHRLPDALLMADPVVCALGLALRDALDQRAPALHADALAQSLALHLLFGRTLSEERAGRTAPTLNAAAVRRAVAYMQERVADDISLDDLAAEAAFSKFHFARVFAKETGETPHRYLVGLRMRRAADLLKMSDEPIHRVASECGYLSAGQFARAFRGRFGVAPSEYRRQLRG